MAKYAENVNQRTKVIDVQKQFPGGLKTVDTDDALGKVYLREAENVSLSEFGFLEKRYGLAEEEEFLFDTQPPNLDRIQGYFEFTKEDGSVDKILFVDGSPYIKASSDTVYRLSEIFYTEPDFVYPDFSGTSVLENLSLSIVQDAYEVSLFTTVSGMTVIANNIINTQIENLDLSLTIDDTIQDNFIIGAAYSLGNVSLVLTINPGINANFIEQPTINLSDLDLSLAVSGLTTNVLEDSIIRAKLTDQTGGDNIDTTIQFEIVGPGSYSDQIAEIITNFYEVVTNVPGGQFDLTVAAPSSFTDNSKTYNFNRFIINGVPQTVGDNDVTLTFSENVDIEILYNTFA